MKSTIINIVYLLAVFCLLFVFVYYPVNLPLVLVALILFLTYNAIGVFYMPAGTFVKSISSAETSEKIICLTFDDGPHTGNTLKILDILDKFNIKAAFFVIGKNAEANPFMIKEIDKREHLLGNHSFNHDIKFTFSKADRVFEELDKTEVVIENLTGKRTRIFRPPFGVTNPSIAKAIKRKAYYTFGWSCRTLDTKINDKTVLFKKLKNGLKPGAIYLMHDFADISVNLLEEFIIFALSEGFKFERPDILFEISAYETIS